MSNETGRRSGRSPGDRESRKAKPKTGRQSRTNRGRTEATAEAAGGSERIARRLARAGVASRREAEALIAAGRIAINGRVLDSPAVNVSLADRITLDGKPIPAIERTRLFLFHKPVGYITTTRDPEGRPTIFDILPQGLPRLVTVGRLDINTEGLLLLTNDGGVARVLELPATGWLRRYRVRVHGKVDPDALAELRNGMAVDGVFYGAVEAVLDREQGSNAWLTIGLREGKNREVKNILGALGLEVTRLIRISYGPFQLGDLPVGAVQEVRGRTLRDQLGSRLIAESGANFEAPLIHPFSNAPVARTEAGPGAAASEKRKEKPETARRHKRPEERREEALGRLETRPPAKDSLRRSEGLALPFPSAGRRRSNVWMAPDARPRGKAKPETEAPSYSAGGKGSVKKGGPRRPRQTKGR
jgi:23S rRNA pseudouridine2605 synthase